MERPRYRLYKARLNVVRVSRRNNPLDGVRNIHSCIVSWIWNYSFPKVKISRRSNPEFSPVGHILYPPLPTLSKRAPYLERIQLTGIPQIQISPYDGKLWAALSVGVS